jgi:hypothetical protein
LEFYSLVFENFINNKKLWYKTTDNSLFPLPISNTNFDNNTYVNINDNINVNDNVNDNVNLNVNINVCNNNDLIDINFNSNKKEKQKEKEKEKEENSKLFLMLGYVIARGIYDDRLIDFPLNALFWDIVLEKVKKIKINFQ